MAKGGKDELDFTSPKFNPLSALYSGSVVVPYPDTTVYDNVASYESAMRFTTAGGRGKESNVKTSSASGSIMGHPVSVRGPVPSSMAIRPKAGFQANVLETQKPPSKARVRKTLWNSLQDGFKKGPFSMLTRCVKERLLVNVCTRNAKDIRGWCKGYIAAFDRHMNLAMVDVDEVYRNPLWLSKSGRRRHRKALQSQVDELTEDSEKGEEEKTASTERVMPREREVSDVSTHRSDNRSDNKVPVITDDAMPHCVTASKDANSALSTSHNTSSAEEVTDCIANNSIIGQETQESLESNLSENLISSCSVSGPKVTDTQQESKVARLDDVPVITATCHVTVHKTGVTKSDNTPVPITTGHKTRTRQTETLESIKPQLKQLKRHVNQLFIRGDSVVTLAILE